MENLLPSFKTVNLQERRPNNHNSWKKGRSLPPSKDTPFLLTLLPQKRPPPAPPKELPPIRVLTPSREVDDGPTISPLNKLNRGDKVPTYRPVLPKYSIPHFTYGNNTIDQDVYAVIRNQFSELLDVFYRSSGGTSHFKSSRVSSNSSSHILLQPSKDKLRPIMDDVNQSIDILISNKASILSIPLYSGLNLNQAAQDPQPLHTEYYTVTFDKSTLGMELIEDKSIQRVIKWHLDVIV